MNFTPHYMPQRSADWYQARIGLLTGSSAKHVLKERKRGTGDLKGRIDLRRRLVCERLTGLAVDDLLYQSEYMERGQQLEDEAFAAYEAQTGLIATRVGFLSHTTLKTGCSPDGYIGEWHNLTGIIELKVPKDTTHLAYIQGNALPDEYLGQVVHSLWLTGAPWCDFCSFNPRFPEPIELFRVRIERDDTTIAAYELAVNLFLLEVERDEQAIRERMKQQEAA